MSNYSGTTPDTIVMDEWPTENPIQPLLHFYRVQGKRRPMLWSKQIWKLI